MSTPQDAKAKVAVPELSLPKGGGSIRGLNESVGVDGMTGMAGLSFPLPVSGASGFAPGLALSYSSGSGNGPFGLGWGVALGAFTRSTLDGRPRYDLSDEFVGPDGERLVPNCGSRDQPVVDTIEKFRGQSLGATYVVQHFMPRIEGAFARIERWWPSDGNSDAARERHSFWVVQGADGSVHLYGRTDEARIIGPCPETGQLSVAQWLLQESVALNGEHILYQHLEGRSNPNAGSEAARERGRARYLAQVMYGNTVYRAQAYLLDAQSEADLSLLVAMEKGNFRHRMLFDYRESQERLGQQSGQEEGHKAGRISDGGERFLQQSSYNFIMENQPWAERGDPFSHYGFGFEVRYLHLCRRVLSYTLTDRHGCTPSILLIDGLRFDYGDDNKFANQIVSVTQFGCAGFEENAQGHAELIDSMPAFRFEYGAFEMPDRSGNSFGPSASWPSFPDARPYQLVDLYGDGMAGILFRGEIGWHYRAPAREVTLSLKPEIPEMTELGDQVKYDAWQPLPAMPAGLATADSTLTDITGDGRLDWVVSAPGLAGFFSLQPDRRWTGFTPFAAMPTEFLAPEARWADLVGHGLMDLALIGPKSVRLYLNERDRGFAAPRDIPYETPHQALPLTSTAADELVAFCDVLGSGQQHLVRVRYNEIMCWPNLGRGRFGAPLPLPGPEFEHGSFNPSNLYFVDLDGSGAADLIYAETNRLRIFRNCSGNGFTESKPLSFPAGTRYDRLAQLTFGDLSGSGCVSAVLSNAFAEQSHVRFDFSAAGKPYLLKSFDSGLGMRVDITYRSSAQEWLDEKHSAPDAINHLPFPVQLVSTITHTDSLTKNSMSQRYRYRLGHYDGREREFRGFGLVMHMDSEAFSGGELADDESFTPPVLTKTWFHTGQTLALAANGETRRDATAFNTRDADQMTLKQTLLFSQLSDEPAEAPVRPLAPDGDAEPLHDETVRQMVRALKGAVLRTEVFGVDAEARLSNAYSVTQARMAVRLIAPPTRSRQARVQVLTLETLTARYDQFMDDPVCSHALTLAWDAYGVPTRTLSIAYGRRREVGCPYAEPGATWWEHAKDPSQYVCWLNEGHEQRIDLVEDCRLGLPYLSSRFAWSIAGEPLASDHKFSYETLSARDAFRDDLKELLGQEQIFYQDAAGAVLPAGQATPEALLDHVETAELDKRALKAYDGVWTEEDLVKELHDAGYAERHLQLPEDLAEHLWVIQHDFCSWASPENFRRLIKFQAFSTVGASTIEYDKYWLHAVSITDAVQNVTRATYDARTGLVTRVTDPNENVHEAAYDGFGRVIATTFYGTENGQPAGFAPLSDWKPGAIGTLAQAIEDPHLAIGAIATRHFYDLHSKPAVSGSLVADQYSIQPRETDEEGNAKPGSSDALFYPPMQVRISLSYTDGFGRALQSLTLTEPGDAYHRSDAGDLALEGDKLLEQKVERRWIVSARIDYNNKGLPVRTYQPFFIDSHAYVNDEALQRHGYFQRHFYDAVGREIKTINAGNVSMRRETFHPWYTVHEDENDTYEEFMAGRESTPEQP